MIALNWMNTKSFSWRLAMASPISRRRSNEAGATRRLGVFCAEPLGCSLIV